jgi:hypothetical protein
LHRFALICSMSVNKSSSSGFSCLKKKKTQFESFRMNHMHLLTKGNTSLLKHIILLAD